MFKKLYKVETIVTPKYGPMYSIFTVKKMTKKEAEKLVNTRKIGLLDGHKDYKWIGYNVEEM